MANVMSLMASLGLDSSDYEQGLDEARSEGESFSGKLGDILGNAAKVCGEALQAIGRAAVDLGKSFVSAVAETAQFGDNIDKTSQKMGLSAQAYQEWDFVMQHAGSSIDSMRTGMRTLVNAAESNSAAFSKLGISQREIASMSQEDLFCATIQALQNVEDKTQRTVLAN